MGATLVAALLFVACPWVGGRVLVARGFGVGALVASAVALWWHRPPHVRLHAISVFAFALQVFNPIVRDVLGLVPTDSLWLMLDDFTIVPYTILACIVALMAHHRAGSDWAGTLDTAVVGCLAFSLMVHSLTDLPTLGVTLSESNPAAALRPLASAVVCSAVARHIMMPGKLPATLRLMFMCTFADIPGTALYYLDLNAGIYAHGGATDLLRLFSCGFVAASLLHPTVPQWSEAVVQPSRTISPVRVAIPMLAFCAVPALVAIAFVNDQASVLSLSVPFVALALSVIRFVLLVIESGRAHHALKEIAERDELTGLVNRAALLQQLRVRANGTGLVGLLFVDLDGFKQVNDNLGHATGDGLLTAVAGRLRQAVRHGDVVGRLGGDEFVVLADGIRDEGEAEEIAERIVRSLGEPFVVGNPARDVTVGASVGVAVGERSQLLADPTGPNGAIEAADVAMLLAKQAGRGRSVVFRPQMSMA